MRSESMSFKPHVGFTPRERQILALLVEGASLGRKNQVEYAAKKLGLAPGSIRNSLHRMRERYYKASKFVNEYREWRKKLERSRVL